MFEIGPSPSGKALGFGPSIRRFESCRSSHDFELKAAISAFFVLASITVGRLNCYCAISQLVVDNRIFFDNWFSFRNDFWIVIKDGYVVFWSEWVEF